MVVETNASLVNYSRLLTDQWKMTGKNILNKEILLKISEIIIPFNPELHLDFSVLPTVTGVIRGTFSLLFGVLLV